jgi:hypothetical protein
LALWLVDEELCQLLCSSDMWTSKVKKLFICAPFPTDLVSVQPEAFPLEFCNSFYLTSYDVSSMSSALPLNSLGNEKMKVPVT